MEMNQNDADKALDSISWEDSDYHATILVDETEIAFRSARNSGNDVVLCSDGRRNEGVATIHDAPFDAKDVEMRLGYFDGL